MSEAAVTLHEASGAEREVVGRLVQFAQHDLAAFRGTVPGDDGRYPVPWLASFGSEPERRRYLIRHGGSLAGTVLTRPLPDGATSVVHFFVVPALRRRSVGLRAALTLFRDVPGRWAVAFQEANAGAVRFWRRVATEAVGEAWTEERRPVPGRADLPPDSWIRLET